jgi:hypothetical protein
MDMEKVKEIERKRSIYWAENKMFYTKSAANWF